jgi:cytochrome c1
MDCHNRPSHTYELPDRAVERAMGSGLISPALPFAKKRAVEVLKADYKSREEAALKIPEGFNSYYRQTYPDVWAKRQAEVSSSAKQVLAIWDRNVFPAMNVKWGVYPNNIGHTDFPGCFRCHDDGHTAKNGKTITQDCSACHNMLAMEEANPKVLTDLGITENQPTEMR